MGGVGQGGVQGGVDGGGPGRRARGGTREQCGSNKAFTGSTFWAPLKREAGRGGRWGGAPESSVGATRHWSDLAGDEGGGVGGVGQGGGQGGVDGGGYQRAVWEQQGVHWFHLLGSLKT